MRSKPRWFSKGDADQRDGCGETRADQRDGFDFYPKRETCKCQKEADEMKNASRKQVFCFDGNRE